jgi:hypothetical protein
MAIVPPLARPVAGPVPPVFLMEERHELYRMAEPDYMKLVRASLGEQDRLRAEIASARPSIPAGRRAMAEVAVSDLVGFGGTYGAIAAAVLRDFMRADGGAA